MNNNNNNNRKYIIGSGILVLVAAVWFFTRTTIVDDANLYAKVKEGVFEVSIQTTGELKSKNSIMIEGPRQIRELNIYQIKIENLIPEGTKVKKGDFVAKLDKSDLMTKLNDLRLDIQQKESKCLETKLDTTLKLQEERDKINNQRLKLKDLEVEVELSKYEPPATIKKRELELEKGKIEYKQMMDNYKVKKKQEAARMYSAGTELSKDKNKSDFIQTMLDQCTITAPEDGIVIYVKGWRGSIKTGSTINPWEPNVASLPDLTKLLSMTYVNEVDISRVKKDQNVEIGIDALPDKLLKGTVIKVANAGEQLPNSDSKVFQVEIEIAGSDTTLLPGMTTSNKIFTNRLDNTLFIPLECLHKNDTLSYVFSRKGNKIVKKQVETGISSENEIVILRGLIKDEELLMTVPEDEIKLELIPL